MRAALWTAAGAMVIVGFMWFASGAHAAECGIASHYGTESGRRTANGESFPSREATAAHRSLPFGSHVRVTDQATGRSIVVRINDRGPAAWTHRIIDLSPAAKRALGMGGLAKVCVERVG